MNRNQQIAQNVLAVVGGKENVTFVAHCMTRLRFNLKDESLINDEEVKAVKGVVGVVKSGGQYQIIIGQNVPEVYKCVCEIGGFKMENVVDENLDGPKEKLTLKRIGNSILNYMSGTVTQLIPGMVAASMFKTIIALIGPDMLGLVAADSHMYILCDFMFDAFFYFLPVFVGYAAAKKLGANVVLGMMLGTMIIAPDFVALVGAQESLSIYGVLPAPVAGYGQTLIPVLVGAPIMAWIEKQLNKTIPNAISSIFVPFLTMFVMVPVMFNICAPLGNTLGNIFGQLLISFSNFGGFFAIAVVAALWEFLVISGMHMVLAMFSITALMTNGVDTFALVAGGCATWAAFGMALGAFFKLKNKDGKALALGYFISGFFGGVTEPALYGIGFRYKKPFIALIIGGFLGGLYAGITNVGLYVIGGNFLAILGFVAGGTANFINGTLSHVISMLVTAVLTYMFGGLEEA